MNKRIDELSAFLSFNSSKIAVSVWRCDKQGKPEIRIYHPSPTAFSRLRNLIWDTRSTVEVRPYLQEKADGCGWVARVKSKKLLLKSTN